TASTVSTSSSDACEPPTRRPRFTHACCPARLWSSGTFIAMATGSEVEEVAAMGDPKDDLRATSESISNDARRVDALEKEKTALDPEDPQVQVISKKVEAVIDTMQDKAAAETALVDEIGASA